MMDKAIEQTRVLVVGGSSGIGLAVAKLAQQKGAHVIVASRRSPERVKSLPQPLNSLEAISFDITSSTDHERLFETIGTIDHLIIAVRAEVHPAPFQSTDIDEAKRAFETKFWGPYRLVQMAYRHMNETGSVTFTSGIAGEKIYSGASSMALINNATESLCRILAVELAPLRVNCVSPGFVEPKPPSVQEYARQFPMKRLASLDEVASAYLCLMANPYVTGNVMVVDGGARLI
jgi:NAD(P)-dependent dehydrogenase (short-subunit alcohol dehydrogenase family)